MELKKAVLGSGFSLSWGQVDPIFSASGLHARIGNTVSKVRKFVGQDKSCHATDDVFGISNRGSRQKGMGL